MGVRLEITRDPPVYKEPSRDEVLADMKRLLDGRVDWFAMSKEVRSWALLSTVAIWGEVFRDELEKSKEAGPDKLAFMTMLLVKKG